VLVAGFAIWQGKRVFERLAANMDANPALVVRIFTNIARPNRDIRSDAELLREFADEFRRDQWPGERLPLVYYDPRALAAGPGPGACLHAKCLIVDDERALVTSANLTQAALDRNIEAGILVEDPAFAERLRAQFDALVACRQLLTVPGLG
jgi:phosphatidylserine/phosphatidylglycerophosphate/cardiolipin synthase-like enzyme